MTGINGELTLGEGANQLGSDQALLMSYGDKAYVVNSGVRMPIDLSDSAVTEALGIQPDAPVQGMSRALYDAVPAGGPLVMPIVPNAGTPSRFNWGPGMVVGSVVASQDVTSGEDRFYVVVGDGVQPVSAVVAAMCASTNPMEPQHFRRFPRTGWPKRLPSTFWTSTTTRAAHCMWWMPLSSRSRAWRGTGRSMTARHSCTC